MRTEGDFIRIYKWLLPLSWLYGLIVSLRNKLFDLGILRSRTFDLPVIAVGNITVGGSGKTPHVEYIVNLLHKLSQVAVISRGYKRKTKGFVLATAQSTAEEIGDEPLQIKTKFPDVAVAVDRNRCKGIEQLIGNEPTKEVDVIVLDDAYQHRYVQPGINILLVDYHRLIIYDKLLPAGRLREPLDGKSRADIVIITKCPIDLKPMEFRVLTKAMNLYPYQSLFFTTFKYGNLYAMEGGEQHTLDYLQEQEHVLLVTGIASPLQMLQDLQKHTPNIVHMSFPDHHSFKKKDIERIVQRFESMPHPRIIITTEKDAARLRNRADIPPSIKQAIYILPVEVTFMLDQEEIFNNKLISYVRKNSRNSILVKRKNDHKSQNSHHTGHGTRTISFRNN